MSLSHDQLTELLARGFIFVKNDTLCGLYDRFKSVDFHGEATDTVMNPVLEGFVSRDVISRQQGHPAQRESWFLSDNYRGPYGDLVTQWLDACEGYARSLMDFLSMPYAMRRSVGVHSYTPMDVPAVNGLGTHKDVDILSAIKSDGPLEGLVDLEWSTITIPRDCVMLFIGITTVKFTGEDNALTHRVPYCDVKKFTVGAFIGARGDQPLYVDRKPTGTSVEEFTRKYFETVGADV